jgi:glycosyltransferase involved in cell wall biosynthesis
MTVEGLMRPRVTFVVPCYNLGHLLGECLTSILTQSFTDLEVLVMDDCSPDATPQVAASIADPRVRHVRNAENLGHLRNYNAGIAMARGEYVWLISADDRLRKPYVVERFVEQLDQHPNVGYVFCPVMRFDSHRETTLYGSHGDGDTVFAGEVFARALARGNSVPAASGLVRRSYYETLGAFPLDLPFAGDWYMWALFALHGDVGYMAEPMVGWRVHANNMTHSFTSRPAALMRDEILVLVRVRDQARATGHPDVASVYDDAIVGYYAWRIAAGVGPHGLGRMTPEQLEASLAEWCHDERERERIVGRAYIAFGDVLYASGDHAEALRWYGGALRTGPLSGRTLTKYGLLWAGRVGQRVRALIHERKETNPLTDDRIPR